MLQAGDLLEGRYRILRTLDEGGMGTVLLAEHVLIKRKVALKLLRAELATDPEVIQRFMNEASVAGRLGHPNIVESTDMGFTSEGVPFIVFEYLEGTLLTHEIYRVKGLTVRRALKIASQIANALEAAHDAGIVHRDLKTDNIFLTSREDVTDHVKVLDFGVSRFAADERSQVIGTPEYMAPEQILTPDKVDKRADIYALGVVLYEMITARRPFQDEDGNTEALLRRIVSEEPPPLTRGEAPLGLQEMLFFKLLAKNPDERYQSMKEVQAAITAFIGISRPTPLSLPAIEMPPETIPPPIANAEKPALAPHVRSEVRRAPLALALFGLAAIGGGFALMMAPREQASTTATPIATIQDDADQIATALDAAANANQLKAEGLASSPMVRAAVETDAATLADMRRDGDISFTLKKGEILELYQRREPPALLLHLPAEAPAIGPTSGIHVHVRAGQLIVSATAGMEQGGLVVVASPVDLTTIKQRISTHALAAAIDGLPESVKLVEGGKGTRMTAPIKGPGGGLQLVVQVVQGTSTERDRFEIVRYLAWGVGGLAVLIFLLLWRRRN
ncbi:MAG: serine/threonine protein kinase [Myxococcota bacterium]|nr:serine/threonine protein kinase [Myxococcota bacterium]